MVSDVILAAATSAGIIAIHAFVVLLKELPVDDGSSNEEYLRSTDVILQGGGGLVFCNSEDMSEEFPIAAEDIIHAQDRGYHFEQVDSMEADEVVVFTIEELCQISRL